MTLIVLNIYCITVCHYFTCVIGGDISVHIDTHEELPLRQQVVVEDSCTPKCSPKGHVLKAWVPSAAEFRR
jgi:hypothetical protein